ncbi:MAG TPA: hypothetical protein C5S51_04245, partial [Methanosarcinaceae archaeon]|nr:hypothetical protein [Methanosarcinaceae archaeon]
MYWCDYRSCVDGCFVYWIFWIVDLYYSYADWDVSTIFEGSEIKCHGCDFVAGYFVFYLSGCGCLFACKHRSACFHIKRVGGADRDGYPGKVKASEAAKDKARTVVDSFEKFIADNRDELTALQIIYSKPYGSRHLTYEGIRQLADAIEKPPYYLTPQLLWDAYEQLDKAKVRGAGPKKLLTDIISLLRFGIGVSDVLEPYSDIVARKFETWVAQQE